MQSVGMTVGDSVIPPRQRCSGIKRTANKSDVNKVLQRLGSKKQCKCLDVVDEK